MTTKSMSGVSVDDAIVKAFDDMKIKHLYRYMQLKISDDKSKIEIEKVEKEKCCTYDTFLKLLPADSCRYILYDYCAKGEETGSRDVLIFIVWCPDTAPVKEKMLYASSKDALKNACKGVAKEIQANDFDDMSAESMDLATKQK